MFWNRETGIKTYNIHMVKKKRDLSITNCRENYPLVIHIQKIGQHV